MTENQRQVLNVALVILVVAAGFFLLTVTGYAPSSRIFDSQKANAKEVPLVIAGDGQTGTVYEFKGGVWEPLDLVKEGEVVAYSRTPNHAATALAYRPQDQLSTQVMVQGLGTSDIFIGNPNTTKSGLTISPDAMYVAYAELTEPRRNTTYTQDASKWEIHMIDVIADEDTTIGQGVAPYFVVPNDNQKAQFLLFSALEGIAVYNMHTGATKIVLENVGVTDLRNAARASSGGPYVAVFNKDGHTYTTFVFARSDPPHLSLLDDFRMPYRAVALTRDTLFGVSREGTMASIYSQRLTDLQTRYEIAPSPFTQNPSVELIP